MVMDKGKFIERLIRFEGLRLKPYTCPAGKLSIGLGRNLQDRGISKREAVFLAEEDYLECFFDCMSIFENWSDMSAIRQDAILDMRFNLGRAGFRTFKKMISAIKNNDWATAALEAKKSKWFSQVQPDRSNFVIEAFLNNKEYC